MPTSSIAVRVPASCAVIGGWVYDAADGTFVVVGEIARRLGVPAGRGLTRGQALRLAAPERRRELCRAVRAALSGAGAFDVELPHLGPNGARRWFRAAGSAEFAGGTFIRLVGALHDLTARDIERDVLRETKERVTLATDAAGIGIWDWDIKGGSAVWDAWIYRLFGTEPTAENEAWFDWRPFVHPDDRAVAQRALSQAVRGPRPLDVEFRVVWSDGSVHHLRCSGRVTRDAAGRAIRLVGAMWDVSEARRLADQLAQQHELLRVTLRSIGDAVITTDAYSRVVWLNPVAERLTGWSTADAKGVPSTIVFHVLNERTREPAEDPIEACLRDGRPTALPSPAVLVSRAGTDVGIEDSAAPIRDDRGVLLGVVLVFKDVTEQRRLSSEMLYRASHDALTGLINRFEFEAHLSRLLGASHQDATEHALLYLDLDQFKIVNDVCGHAVGDRLLQQVARLLGNLVRASDMIARIGGDEFAILLEHCSLERAEWIAQQICDQMDQFRFVHDERRFRVGTSIGLVPIDARWTTPAQILAAADTCCYAAKEDGRNRTRTWLDSDLAIRVRHGEMQWTSRIENALDEDRFVLYAQRIHPLGPRRDDVHAEVLLRLPDADGSLVLPGAFLPAAERFGLASRIDRCVLAKVLAWLANARDADRIENLCVNLSGQSVGDRNFHQWAVEALRAAGPAICAKLCFEVTETSAVTSLADAAAFIDHVHALNIRVALDDFGAGASSFGYLKTMPVDFLKIDGQFVSNVVESALDEATVRCFIDIAAVVNVKTVAEMVSSAAVLERLVRLGVDYVQGFFMDRPAPIDELLTGGAFAADGRNR